MEQAAQVVTLTAPQSARGTRLDAYLAAAARAGSLGPAVLSRSRLQALIAAGRIWVGAGTGRAALRLRGGEALALHLPAPRPSALTPCAMAITVLYEDADLLALDKPAGLTVHPGAGTVRPTLVHGLLAHCRDLSGVGGELRPGIVHRLDRGTSGVMVVAKHDAAHHGLAAQFAARSVGKRYVAICHGAPAAAAGRIDTPYGRHPRHRQRFTGAAGGRGRPRRAVTDYAVRVRTAAASLLALTLHTGRTHQIRVHLAELGHPLVGDRLYGGRPAPVGLGAAAACAHQALHAAALRLRHPITGAPLHLCAAPPPALSALAAALGWSPCAVKTAGAW